MLSTAADSFLLLGEVVVAVVGAAHVGQDAIVTRYLRFEEYDNLGLLLAFYIKLVPTP
jgi:hypothetical protein